MYVRTILLKEDSIYITPHTPHTTSSLHTAYKVTPHTSHPTPHTPHTSTPHTPHSPPRSTGHTRGRYRCGRSRSTPSASACVYCTSPVGGRRWERRRHSLPRASWHVASQETGGRGGREGGEGGRGGRGGREGGREVERLIIIATVNAKVLTLTRSSKDGIRIKSRVVRVILCSQSTTIQSYVKQAPFYYIQCMQTMPATIKSPFLTCSGDSQIGCQ